jgi:FkbM family methyltransferase
VLGAALRKWRENYYLSKILAPISRCVYESATFLASQISSKVKTNGVPIRLPHGRILRTARNCGIGLSSLLYWRGLDGYEPATSRTLTFFFERVNTFVDVGANYGLYSLLAALWNPRISVTAFEPVPKIYECLTRNVHANGLTERISTHQLALSDRSGKTAFYLPPSQSLDLESTGTLVAESWQNRKPHTTLEIEAVKFDEFEALHPMRVELVKIDVEDFEASVLSGMTKTILRDRPIIVCEILPREHRNQPTLLAIRELGYTPYWITSDGFILVTDFDFERNSSQDFLLSPRPLGHNVITNPAAFLPDRS